MEPNRFASLCLSYHHCPQIPFYPKLICKTFLSIVPLAGDIHNIYWASRLQLAIESTSIESFNRWSRVKDIHSWTSWISYSSIIRGCTTFLFYSLLDDEYILIPIGIIALLPVAQARFNRHLLDQRTFCWIQNNDPDLPIPFPTFAKKIRVVEEIFSQCTPLFPVLYHIHNTYQLKEWFKERSDKSTTYHQTPIPSEAKAFLLKRHIRDTTFVTVGQLFQVITGIVLYMLFCDSSFDFNKGHAYAVLTACSLTAPVFGYLIYANATNIKVYRKYQREGSVPENII